MKKIDNTKTVERFAVAYCRVSSEEQILNFSISNQIEACKKEAAARGYTLIDSNIFIDPGFSATTTKRPALIKMLAACQNKKNRISAVITYKIDRLSRDTADYLGMRKVLGSAGVKVISCTEPIDDSPASEFIETILAAAGRYDNQIKIERIKAGIIQRLKSGLHNKAPFGYLNRTIDGKKLVVVDERLAPLVRDAFLEMNRGTYTLDGIAKYLNGQLLLLNHPYRFYRQQVSRLFTNKTYIGYAVSKKHGDFKSDKIPSLVDESIFYRVRALLMGRNEHPVLHQKIRPEFPLRGLVLCITCNSPLTGGYCKSRSGKYYGYYFCKLHAKPALSVDKLDKAMVRLMQKLTPDPLLKRLCIDEIKKRYNDKYLLHIRQEDRMKMTIAELKKQQVEIAKKNAKGTIRDDVAQKAIEDIENEIISFQTIKSESRLAQLDIEVLAKFMESFLSDMSLFYRGEYPVELKRVLIGSIFPKKLYFRNNEFEPVEIEPAFNLKRGDKHIPILLGAPGDSQFEPIIEKWEALRQVYTHYFASA